MRRRIILGASLVVLTALCVLGFILTGGSDDAAKQAGDPYAVTFGAGDDVPTGSTSAGDAPEPTLLKSGAKAAFGEIVTGLPGSNGIAVSQLNGSEIASFGSLRSGHGWSTMKVPVVVTLMRESEDSGTPLTSSQRANAAAALTRSDNDAAKALFQDLVGRFGGVQEASAKIDETLRAAGDTRTEVNTVDPGNGFTTFGQTDWSVGSSLKFFRALARQCLLSKRGTQYVLRLMQRVEGSQRWGAGSAGYRSSLIAFKGGWGPESDNGYLVRQAAIIGKGNSGIVISMIAKPEGGDTFAAGQNAMTELAKWAREYVSTDGPQSSTCTTQ